MSQSRSELQELIIEEMMGWCGCGQPEYVIEILYHSVEHIHSLKHKVWEKTMTYKDWEAKGLKIFNDEGIEHLIYYVLHEKKFTEHGGAVPGWLTEKGYKLWDKLKEWESSPIEEEEV